MFQHLFSSIITNGTHNFLLAPKNIKNMSTVTFMSTGGSLISTEKNNVNRMEKGIRVVCEINLSNLALIYNSYATHIPYDG